MTVFEPADPGLVTFVGGIVRDLVIDSDGETRAAFTEAMRDTLVELSDLTVPGALEFLQGLLFATACGLARAAGCSPRTVADDLFSVTFTDPEWHGTELPALDRLAALIRSHHADAAASESDS